MKYIIIDCVKCAAAHFMYLAATTLDMKEKALAKTVSRLTSSSRYRPGDSLLSFLNKV